MADIREVEAEVPKLIDEVKGVLAEAQAEYEKCQDNVAKIQGVINSFLTDDLVA